MSKQNNFSNWTFQVLEPARTLGDYWDEYHVWVDDDECYDALDAFEGDPQLWYEHEWN